MILESQSKHEITYFKSSNNELILNLIKNYSFCLVRLCSIVMSSEEAPQKKKKREWRAKRTPYEASKYMWSKDPSEIL